METFDDLLLFVLPVISQADGDGTQDNRISLLSWLVIVLALGRGDGGRVVGESWQPLIVNNILISIQIAGCFEMIALGGAVRP